MSDNFRIFVSRNEIVIRIFTIKTPRRWAKRQRDMRNLRFKENTIKDLGTLNRGQSILLNLYIQGFTHVNLDVYTHGIELTAYAYDPIAITTAENIIRNQMADGDTIENQELENQNGPFTTIQWRGHLLETEDRES